MKRIRIVIPYFGILPPPFRFWWQSALANPTVDFLFVTDCGELQTEPTNHYLFIPNRIIPFRSYGLQDILRWTK